MQHTEGAHVFASEHGLETNEGHLHTGKSADGIPRGVSDVKTVGVTTHDDEDQCVQRNHVRDERITTCCKSDMMCHSRTSGRLAPRRDHVEVEYSSYCAEEGTALLEGLDPCIECEHKQEDSNGLVIIRASHGTGNISWDDANERSGEKTSALIFQLFCKPDGV